jgi:hypothetical protein
VGVAGINLEGKMREGVCENEKEGASVCARVCVVDTRKERGKREREKRDKDRKRTKMKGDKGNKGTKREREKIEKLEWWDQRD